MAQTSGKNNLNLPRLCWQSVVVDDQHVATLATELSLPLPILQVLVARGITTPDSALRFLEPDMKLHLSDPALFPGIAKGAELIWEVIHQQGQIVVFGDFDVDGVAASAILFKTIQTLGGIVDVFIPSRFEEGYGLTLKALERCLSAYTEPPQLMITVDCGISSPDEVAFLKQQGIKVLITDHHEPSTLLPTADVIVNPKLGEVPAGSDELCGAGVALKLAHATVAHGKEQGWFEGRSISGELIVTAGLATVADVVPLHGENRLLVWSALQLWQRWASTGLRTLLSRAARVTTDTPDAFTFGFLLGPRINAAGRMDSAQVAFELLVTDCPDRALHLSATLEGFNGRRKSVEERMLAAACHQCGYDIRSGRFSEAALVAAGQGSDSGDEGWHPGVAGIVASRICEVAGCPTAIISFDSQGRGRGSLRVGAGYHALQSLQSVSNTLERFGGHAGAAGFLVKPGAYAEFKQLFTAACLAQSAQVVAREPLQLAGWLTPADLTFDFLAAQQQLAPFGHGNPLPCWGMHNVTLTDVKPVGSSGEHLQMQFKSGRRLLPRGIWFRYTVSLEALRAYNGKFDIAFELHENHYAGETYLSLHIIDLTPLPPDN